MTKASKADSSRGLRATSTVSRVEALVGPTTAVPLGNGGIEPGSWVVWPSGAVEGVGVVALVDEVGDVLVVALFDGVVVLAEEEGVVAGTVPPVVGMVVVLTVDPPAAPGEGVAGTEGVVAPTGATAGPCPCRPAPRLTPRWPRLGIQSGRDPDLSDLGWAHAYRITADSLAQPGAPVSS